MKEINVRIRANFDLCTGCDICRLNCSFRIHGGYNPRMALLRIDEGREGLTSFPVICQQCQNAFCIKVCPHGAMVRDDKSNIPAVLQDKCRKCGMCISYCPLGVIIRGTDGIAFKCDLCEGDPLCVKSCPTGALTLVREVTANE